MCIRDSTTANGSEKAYHRAVEHLAEIFSFVPQHNLLEQNTIYNINIPENPTGIRITRQGGPYYSDDFPPIGDDLYEPKGICVYVNHNDLTLDTDSVMSGHISITPLTTDRTDRTLYEQLNELDK